MVGINRVTLALIRSTESSNKIKLEIFATKIGVISYYSILQQTSPLTDLLHKIHSVKTQ